MGFSFRGKGKVPVDDQPVAAGDGQEVTTSGYEGTNTAVTNADVHIRRLKDQHRFDPFMQEDKLDAIDDAIETGDVEKEAAIETSLIGENSPYVEVRNAVSPTPSARLAKTAPI